MFQPFFAPMVCACLPYCQNVKNMHPFHFSNPVFLSSFWRVRSGLLPWNHLQRRTVYASRSLSEQWPTAISDVSHTSRTAAGSSRGKTKGPRQAPVLDARPSSDWAEREEFFRDVGWLKLFCFVNVDSRPTLRQQNGSKFFTGTSV